MAVTPGAIFASAGLTVLTLSVFWSAQAISPQSTVRRFLQSVAQGDSRGAQRSVWEPIESPVGSFLINRATAIHQLNGETTVVRQDSNGDLITLVTRTEGTQGLPRLDVWVVQRREGRWRINADLTLRNAIGIF